MKYLFIPSHDKGSRFGKSKTNYIFYCSRAATYSRLQIHLSNGKEQIVKVRGTLRQLTLPLFAHFFVTGYIQVGHAHLQFIFDVYDAVHSLIDLCDSVRMQPVNEMRLHLQLFLVNDI